MWPHDDPSKIYLEWDESLVHGEKHRSGDSSQSYRQTTLLDPVFLALYPISFDMICLTINIHETSIHAKRQEITLRDLRTIGHHQGGDARLSYYHEY